MDFRYSAAARFFHWFTALLIVAIVTLGFWITQFEPADEAFKLRLYNIHESLGLLLFVTVVVRLLVRFSDPPAPLSNQPALIRLASRANHWALYAVLLIQPVIGFLDTNAWGFPLTWFGIVPVPSPIGKQPEQIAQQFSSTHWIGAMLLITLVTLHLLGAAYHGLVKRDGVVSRMT